MIRRACPSVRSPLSLFISYAFDGASFCSTTRLDYLLEAAGCQLYLGGPFLTPDSALEVLLEVSSPLHISYSFNQRSPFGTYGVLPESPKVFLKTRPILNRTLCLT